MFDILYCVVLSYKFGKNEREKGRDTEIERKRDKQRERQIDRQTDRQRERHA